MSQQEVPASGYNQGHNPETGMSVELLINDRAQATILYDRPFSKKLSWLEYDLDSSKLDFVLEDGDLRNFGIPVHPKLAKYMQNAYQVLMVQVDKEADESYDNGYVPLIIHRA